MTVIVDAGVFHHTAGEYEGALRRQVQGQPPMMPSHKHMSASGLTKSGSLEEEDISQSHGLSEHNDLNGGLPSCPVCHAICLQDAPVPPAAMQYDIHAEFIRRALLWAEIHSR